MLHHITGIFAWVLACRAYANTSTYAVAKYFLYKHLYTAHCVGIQQGQYMR